MPIDLEDFATPAAAAQPEPSALEKVNIEAARTSAYEEGYSAGWEDATQRQAEDQAHISAEFARHLQELSFTFHEARAHVIEAVRPLLGEIAATFLPRIVSETLGDHLLEIMEPLLVDAADQPVLLTVSTGAGAALSERMEGANTATINIVEDDTLAEGQAFLKLGQVERKVDLTQAIAQFQSAIQAMGNLNERVIKHG